MPAEPQKLINFIKSRFEGATVYSAYEAGFCGFVLHRKLLKSGIYNIVVHAASIEVAMNSRVKTDKRDSSRIATQLKNGSLVPNHVPTQQQELEKTLIRTRFQLRKELTRIGIQIKSKMLQFGFIASDDDRVMNRKRIREYEALDLPGELRIAITALKQVFIVLTEEVLKLEAEMEKLLDRDPEIKKIYLSVPGIGRLTTSVLYSELGDMSRFPNTKKLSSFLGLTPSEWSSGEKVRKGRTTKQGSGLIRGLIVEGAWYAVRKDPSLKVLYERIKIKRGGRRAIVAVARHLMIKLRACLAARTLYEVRAT